MDVLVIGVSSIFRRRVLPALLSLDCVDRIHLASMRPDCGIDIPEGRRGRYFWGYEDALRELQPCLAYVSLPNSMHAEWASRALTAGFHTVIDKPAVLDPADADSLLALARRQRLCLAEASVWAFHSQVARAAGIFSAADGELRAIQSVFSFPPLSEPNFRNDPRRGGGSFYDLGMYALSPGRVFFGEDPTEIWCRVLDRSEALGIDTAFALSAVFSRGRILEGFFSFGTEYKNRLLLLGANASVTIEPAFTIPKDMPTTLTIRAMNKTEAVAIPAEDTFANFFGAVIRSIEAERWDQWPTTLWRDMNVLHRAAIAAGIRKP